MSQRWEIVYDAERVRPDVPLMVHGVLAGDDDHIWGGERDTVCLPGDSAKVDLRAG